MSIENFEIKICPKCHKTHNYKLEVKRSIVLGFSGEAESKKSFTRLFTCPETQDDFEIIFTLTESNLNKINQVVVLKSNKE
jgi:hypothetical protein